MAKVLKDRLFFNDNKPEQVQIPTMHKSGLWAKTEIMASYDDVEYDKNGIAHFVKKIPTGISKLGETLFRTEKTEPLWSTSNMVPIGGCQFAMEAIFGVKGTQFATPTLYNNTTSGVNNIGLPDSLTPTETYDIPGGVRNIVHRQGNCVQLFGIGITGTAENDVTVHNVDYRENSIDINRVTSNGLTLTGTMIPFRYTSEVLPEAKRVQYFGKKANPDTGEVAYYLKRFESDPVIKHIWKTGEDVENEALVSSSDIWSNNVGSNAIESFAEAVLKISKEDVKEWFISVGQEDRARINTLALFTGEYVKNSDGTIGDYRDVCMFSKLNIPVEHLSLSKDLNFIYRVYTT